MNSTSTIYTMGTALSRACDNHVLVALLVEGQWVHGRVVALDGHGVILDADVSEHAVVKLERVSAVRVMTPVPPTAIDAVACLPADSWPAPPPT